jgi:ATP-dependent Clp protease ATP-binding subunit ClpC
MFERYTENARRAIFFARYEASHLGSGLIEPEHLLLALLRESTGLAYRLLRSSAAAAEGIRSDIEAHITPVEKTSTSVDLPLSQTCKHVLALASEEAERLTNEHIDSEHLLLGILREETSFAAGLLRERGITLDIVREKAQKSGHSAD